MVGRKEQIELMDETLRSKKSSFVAFTGRRRVGKTYLINQVYGEHICLRITGIQGVDTKTQLRNFVQKFLNVVSKPFFLFLKIGKMFFLCLKAI